MADRHLDKYAPARSSSAPRAGSGGGQTAQSYLAAYPGTKAWNTNFSVGIWAKLRPYGVGLLNAIVGSTNTPGSET